LWGYYWYDCGVIVNVVGYIIGVYADVVYDVGVCSICVTAIGDGVACGGGGVCVCVVCYCVVYGVAGMYEDIGGVPGVVS